MNEMPKFTLQQKTRSVSDRETDSTNTMELDSALDFEYRSEFERLKWLDKPEITQSNMLPPHMALRSAFDENQICQLSLRIEV